MLLEMMDIPKIFEDEDIVSWIFAIANENGWDTSSFVSAFFPDNINCRRDTFSVVIDYCHIYKKCKALGFPEPQDMLMKHTAVPVSGLFTHAFHTGMMADLILYGSDTLPFERTRIHSPFMYCPQCAKEDLAVAGRIVAHIPHQVQGVTACYRHGVKLSKHEDANIEEADRQEVRRAQMIQALYKAQAVGSLEDIAGPLRDRIRDRGMNLPSKSNRFPVDTVQLELAAELFTDGELVRIYDKDDDWILQCADIIRKDDPDSRQFKRKLPFVSYSCGKCGSRVTQYAITAITGGMCPVCARRTQWQAKTARRARHCIDPEYRIVRFHRDRKADIRHIPCGHILEGRSIGYIFRMERMSCPFCRKTGLDFHLGEHNLMNCGLWAEITRFGSSTDVDVRFEDGSERRGIQYSNFRNGTVIPELYYLDSHIGEKRIMNCGLVAEITAYRNKTDCDVRFETGDEKNGVTYAAFKAGKLEPDGYRKRKAAEGIVGQWRSMNCGLKARIIRYANNRDCDVEFEDGSVRRGVRRDHFENGELSPEGFGLPRIGEERVMRNGLTAKIIAVRSSMDIDVRFGNGEVRKNVRYSAFRDGYIRSLLFEEEQKDSHIGEVYRQNCGMYAEVIEYTNAHCCTVRFANGEVREGAIYRKLKEGKVLPPSLQNIDRVGEKHMQECGQEAEITAYRDANDVYVKFPDGKTREHVAYYDIVRGKIGPLKRGEKFRAEHLGEERTMKCGLKAKIIEVRSAKDIDVEFETGEVREHVVYANFKIGGVSPKKRKW